MGKMSNGVRFDKMLVITNRLLCDGDFLERIETVAAKKPKGIGTSFFKECRSKIKRMSAAGLCTSCGRFDKSTGKLAGY